ncbi:hypothetical protein BLNAU_15873 [Blattamonas nauphoetae]|uniref:RRM domain-containing protein n=1 Tax=Blattamonas nauphoetae TaxID=2049346 RepID=A0ABQ9X9A7_9EUKA|nr:hypothetical protein BLNAU_15873 [Blattamonas nauphoetae]
MNLLSDEARNSSKSYVFRIEGIVQTTTEEQIHSAYEEYGDIVYVNILHSFNKYSATMLIWLTIPPQTFISNRQTTKIDDRFITLTDVTHLYSKSILLIRPLARNVEAPTLSVFFTPTVLVHVWIKTKPTSFSTEKSGYLLFDDKYPLKTAITFLSSKNWLSDNKLQIRLASNDECDQLDPHPSTVKPQTTDTHIQPPPQPPTKPVLSPPIPNLILAPQILPQTAQPPQSHPNNFQGRRDPPLVEKLPTTMITPSLPPPPVLLPDPRSKQPNIVNVPLRSTQPTNSEFVLIHNLSQPPFPPPNPPTAPSSTLSNDVKPSNALLPTPKPKFQPTKAPPPPPNLDSILPAPKISTQFATPVPSAQPKQIPPFTTPPPTVLERSTTPPPDRCPPRLNLSPRSLSRLPPSHPLRNPDQRPLSITTIADHHRHFESYHRERTKEHLQHTKLPNQPVSARTLAHF